MERTILKGVIRAERRLEKKLCEQFDLASALEKRLQTDEQAEKLRDAELKTLLARVDTLTDKLLAAEELIKCLQRTSHEHKVIK